jgi:hypothetical protein
MTITLTDMRDAIKGQPKADEAIFWFCNAWHSGAGSDLYRAMVETNFHPDQHRQKQIANDPEILYCFDVLGKRFGPLVEYPMAPVKFADVRENDVLTACDIFQPEFRAKYGERFICIENGWPCRVYKWHGDLGVACAEDHRGKQFHVLEVDHDGYVVGFQR